MATVTPTEERVNSILAAVNTAEAAADYVDDQICEMQLVSGENYNMVWNVPGAGNFPPAQ